MRLADVAIPYEECEVRNSINCERITPAQCCSTYYDADGEPRLCCRKCDPPEAEAW